MRGQTAKLIEAKNTAVRAEGWGEGEMGGFSQSFSSGR